jgi:hypothetical protein
LRHVEIARYEVSWQFWGGGVSPGGCRTLVGRPANPSSRPIFPPIPGPRHPMDLQIGGNLSSHRRILASTTKARPAPSPFVPRPLETTGRKETQAINSPAFGGGGHGDVTTPGPAHAEQGSTGTRCLSAGRAPVSAALRALAPSRDRWQPAVLSRQTACAETRRVWGCHCGALRCRR